MEPINKFASVKFDTHPDAITAFILVADREPTADEAETLRKRVIPSASPMVLQRKAREAFNGRPEFHAPPRPPKPPVTPKA